MGNARIPEGVLVQHARQIDRGLNSQGSQYHPEYGCDIIFYSLRRRTALGGAVAVSKS